MAIRLASKTQDTVFYALSRACTRPISGRERALGTTNTKREILPARRMFCSEFVLNVIQLGINSEENSRFWIPLDPHGQAPSETGLRRAPNGSSWAVGRLIHPDDRERASGFDGGRPCEHRTPLSFGCPAKTSWLPRQQFLPRTTGQTPHCIPRKAPGSNLMAVLVEHMHLVEETMNAER